MELCFDVRRRVGAHKLSQGAVAVEDPGLWSARRRTQGETIGEDVAQARSSLRRGVAKNVKARASTGDHRERRAVGTTLGGAGSFKGFGERGEGVVRKVIAPKGVLVVHHPERWWWLRERRRPTGAEGQRRQLRPCV